MFLDFLTSLKPGLPMAIVIVVGTVVLFALMRFLHARIVGQADKNLRIQLIGLLLSATFVIVIILASPLNDTRQGQILNLIGIVLSAAIALSSTNIIGNAMAGLMIRAVRSFQLGDFIRVGEHFGRVTERGLFHVEIQTEDRDLTTLPNTYLITNPVRVTYATGTLLWAEVSLGYDIPRTKVDKALREAATAAELQDPFVHVMELTDYSVNYRVVGLLPEVRNIVSTRSRLREQMLDKLHAAGIEIVSPTFMNTRALTPESKVMPDQAPLPPPVVAPKDTEAIMFEKADKAQSIEELRQHLGTIGQDITKLEEEIRNTSDERQKDLLNGRLGRLRGESERLQQYLETSEDTKPKKS